MRHDRLELARMVSNPEEFNIAVSQPKEKWGAPVRSMRSSKELEELLKQLEGLDVSDPQFPRCVSRIQEVPADHVSDEESGQFPKMRAAIPAETLVELRGKVEMAEKIAPTRPHPQAPHSELFHKLVGPGVGMVDRLRDALSGRTTG